MKKILITGKTGYLAKALMNSFSQEHEITCIGREDFPLTDRDAVEEWFKDKRFDVVLHTATAGGNRLFPETDSVLSDNLKMFFNLLSQKGKYDKFINFSSMAEQNLYQSVYGLSKHITAKYVQDQPRFYNLRICGLFDQNDLDTRFIKCNINRYIQKQDIVIHNDKYMDFIYMEDLMKIVEFYIKSENPPKLIDCVYNKKYTLVHIAHLINNLDDYKCSIDIHNFYDIGNYIGDGQVLDSLRLKLIGLEHAIKAVYVCRRFG